MLVDIGDSNQKSFEVNGSTHLFSKFISCYAIQIFWHLLNEKQEEKAWFVRMLRKSTTFIRHFERLKLLNC